MTTTSTNDRHLSSINQPHVLIIGAGITGLLLGQSLKQRNVPFTIFERDPTVSARGRGWGLTIHWSLQTFLSLLPQRIIDRLPETFVDPEASQRGENGNFLFFDLRSGEAKWKVPPNQRIRVSRERLRALLLDGLDVQVNTVDQIFPNHGEADYMCSGRKRSHPSRPKMPTTSPPTSPTPPLLKAPFSLEPMDSAPACALPSSTATLTSHTTNSFQFACLAYPPSTLPPSRRNYAI